MITLSALDAALLRIENDALHRHVAAVGIYEGPPLPHEAIEGKLPLVPRYRQRVRFVPLEPGAPVWVDDPQFTLDDQIRYTTLPAPGGEWMRIGAAIGSYGKDITFGITGDYDATADLDILARGIERGIAELVGAAEGETS